MTSHATYYDDDNDPGTKMNWVLDSSLVKTHVVVVVSEKKKKIYNQRD